MKTCHKLAPVLGLAALLLATSTSAAPFELFNFAGASPTGLRGRDVSTNSIDYTGDGNATDSYTRFSFADLDSSGWSSETAEPRLYGGAAAVLVNKNATMDTYGYGSSGLDIRVQSNAPVDGVTGDITPAMNPYRLAAFWEVADTDAGDLYSIRTNASRLERVTGRILLRNTDGNFYVSQGVMSTGDVTLNEAAIENENWAQLNAASWLNDNTFAPVTLDFNVATSSIGTVQGVGFMADRGSTNGNRVWVTLSEFEVQAIPEPGTLALVGIALGSLLLFRRKK
jgi:hypothetical protein